MRKVVCKKAVTRPVGGGTEKVIYEATHDPSQKPEVVLRIVGTSKLELVIYFDGVQASSKIIEFTN